MTPFGRILQSIALMTALSLLWLCLRARAGQRVNVRARYAVGLILMVGLLVPIRPVLSILPAQQAAVGQVSMVPDTARVEAANVADAQAADNESLSAAKTPVAGAFAKQSIALMLPPEDLVAAPSDRSSSSVFARIIAELDFARVAGIVWVAGALVALCVQVVRHVRFCRLMRRHCERPMPHEVQMLAEECQNLSIHRAPRLCRCDLAPAPMLSGLIRPVVTLPGQALADAETRLVLRHELVHLRRRDLWGKALVLLTSIVHWYNPAVYVLAKTIDADCEMACDQAALSGADAGQRTRYGHLLLAAAFGQGLCPPLSTGLTQGGVHMKKRIVSLLDPRPGRAGGVLIALALVLTFVCGIALAQEAGLVSPTTGLPTEKEEYRPVMVGIMGERRDTSTYSDKDGNVTIPPHVIRSRPRGLLAADIVYEVPSGVEGHTNFVAIYNDTHTDAANKVDYFQPVHVLLQGQWGCPFVAQIEDVFGNEDTVPMNPELIPPQMNYLYDLKMLYGRKDMAKELTTGNGDVFYVKGLVDHFWPTDESTGEAAECTPPAWRFSDKPSKGETEAVSIRIPYDPYPDDAEYDIRFSYVLTYVYQSETRQYERFHNDLPHLDGRANKQLAATNVILQYCDITQSNVRYYDLNYESHNRQQFSVAIAPEPTLDQASGTMVAFIDGRATHGTWRFNEATGQTEYLDAKGSPITLLPGKTFIHILDTALTTTYEDAAGQTHEIIGEVFQ